MDEERPIAILAVDDEPGVLTLVRRCLKDQHITLVEASSGEDALALLSKGLAFDLLITDLRMPGMEGDELARQARTLVPDLKVLYLTGHADRLFGASQELRAEEAYLDKPFTREGLREAVALLLFGRTTLPVAPSTADDDKNCHDFKNQLTIIRGFAAVLLTDSAAGDPRRHDIEEIHKAAETALELLARLYPAREG